MSFYGELSWPFLFVPEIYYHLQFDRYARMTKRKLWSISYFCELRLMYLGTALNDKEIEAAEELV